MRTDSPDPGGYRHRARLCKRCLCFTPSKCYGMEKAKQINLKPTAKCCRDKIQGRKGESEPATSRPCLSKCRTGLSGARSEKNNQSTSGGWYKWSAARCRDEPLAQLRIIFKTCTRTRVVLVGANQGCAPTHGVQTTLTNGGLPTPPKNLGPTTAATCPPFIHRLLSKPSSESRLLSPD